MFLIWPSVSSRKPSAKNWSHLRGIRQITGNCREICRCTEKAYGAGVQPFAETIRQAVLNPGKCQGNTLLKSSRSLGLRVDLTKGGSGDSQIALERLAALLMVGTCIGKGTLLVSFPDLPAHGPDQNVLRYRNPGDVGENFALQVGTRSRWIPEVWLFRTPSTHAPKLQPFPNVRMFALRVRNARNPDQSYQNRQGPTETLRSCL